MFARLAVTGIKRSPIFAPVRMVQTTSVINEEDKSTLQKITDAIARKAKQFGAAEDCAEDKEQRKTERELHSGKIDQWQMEAVEGDRKWQEECDDRGPGFRGTHDSGMSA